MTNSSVKYFVPVRGAAAFCLVMFGFFFKVHPLSGRELGVLTEGVSKLASDWETKKVPSSSRVVTLVIADAQSGADPYVAGAPREADGRVQAPPTPFARAVGDSNSVVWCPAGFSSVSRE